MTRRLVWLVSIALTIVVGSASSAFADCHGDGDGDGSGTTNVGPTTSSQYLAWSLSSRTMTVRAMNSDNVSTNYCLEARNDWITDGVITPGGHYDARASRNCDATSNSTRGGTITEPSNWGGRTVRGLQKAAGCIYDQYPAGDPPEYLGCVYVAASKDGCTFPQNSARAWTAMSHAVFLRREDGTTDYNDGGAVSSPDN